MAINLQGLRRAAEALETVLRAEADAQNAHLFRFPDGRVSLELEWIDIQAIAYQVVVAYEARDTEPLTIRGRQGR
jgi:hypothetical protein